MTNDKKTITLEFTKYDANAIIEACGALAGLLDKDQETRNYFASTADQLEDIARRIEQEGKKVVA